MCTFFKDQSINSYYYFTLILTAKVGGRPYHQHFKMMRKLRLRDTRESHAKIYFS